MADPVSVLALLGLVYTGKMLAENPVSLSSSQQILNQGGPGPSKIKDATKVDVEQINLNTDFKINSEERQLTSPQVAETATFADIVPQTRSSGGEVLDMKDRFATGLNVHNNLASIPKQQVGPGLGVGADVPAVGGFQQMFRAIPENVGAYRLTTLPGRAGPGFDPRGGRGQNRPIVGNNKPEKTAFLPDRRPPVLGRAQGPGGPMSGVTVRSSQQRTMRTTNRSETGARTDGLQYAPAKKIVAHGSFAQGPTRNKTDIADGQYAYMDNAAPGISSFYGAYENSTLAEAAGNKVRTPAELARYGLRLSDRRATVENRGANAGRMNVRGNPLQAHGMVTAVRSDNNRLDGYTGPANAGWTQQYVKTKYQDLNPYKGQENKLDLELAKRQLKNNPLAHTLSN